VFWAEPTPVAEALDLLAPGAAAPDRRRCDVSAFQEQSPTTRLPEMPDHMMTIAEVAEYLEVSVRWVEDAV
jgi:hypothetical protein